MGNQRSQTFISMITGRQRTSTEKVALQVPVCSCVAPDGRPYSNCPLCKGTGIEGVGDGWVTLPAGSTIKFHTSPELTDEQNARHQAAVELRNKALSARLFIDANLRELPPEEVIKLADSIKRRQRQAVRDAFVAYQMENHDGSTSG